MCLVTGLKQQKLCILNIFLKEISTKNLKWKLNSDSCRDAMEILQKPYGSLAIFSTSYFKYACS